MRQVLLHLLSIVLVASLLPGAASEAQSTQVRVVPPSSQVAPGALVTIEVQVHDVLSLYAVDLQLAFDPALLEVVDADSDPANGTQITAGALLGSANLFTVKNQAENGTGQVRYVASLLAPATPVSGSGALASITFRARDPGTGSLLLSVLLANDLAEYIPAEVHDGAIVVTGSTATPTVTIAATRTPTRTATPVATLTRTATPVVTLTPSPTATRTPTRTGTPPVPDHFLWLPLLLRAHSVPTLTPLPSATPTRTATMDPGATPTLTPTVVGSPSPSPTGGFTPAATLSATPTPISSAVPSPTASGTPGATLSPTPSATRTASPTTSATPAGTATVSPTPESRQLLGNYDFEDDTVWSLDGGSPPVYTMARAYHGGRSVRLGIILPASVTIYSSISQVVTLPRTVVGASLSFYYFPAGSPEDDDDIYVYVYRASDDAILFGQRWMRWEQAWHSYTVDLLSQLQPHAGEDIRLRVGVKNNRDGMTQVYVDYVELRVAGSGFPAASYN